MRSGACSSNFFTVVARPLETASHRGVALLRPELHWPSSSTVACSTTRVCPCKRRPLWAQTVTDVFVYELLWRLFHIGNFCFWVSFLKQLLLRNCAMDFVEICNVYVRKMIIKAAKRIFNSDKICRSYSDLNFGVTFRNTVYSQSVYRQEKNSYLPPRRLYSTLRLSVRLSVCLLATLRKNYW